MKVTVLLGGPSAEREISLISGRAVAEALRQAGHEVFESDISPGDLSALDDAPRALLVEQIARTRGIAEFQEYINALRGYYTHTVAEDRL